MSRSARSGSTWRRCVGGQSSRLGLVVLARLGISADDVRRALGERLERDAA